MLKRYSGCVLILVPCVAIAALAYLYIINQMHWMGGPSFSADEAEREGTLVARVHVIDEEEGNAREAWIEQETQIRRWFIFRSYELVPDKYYLCIRLRHHSNVSIADFPAEQWWLRTRSDLYPECVTFFPFSRSELATPDSPMSKWNGEWPKQITVQKMDS